MSSVPTLNDLLIDELKDLYHAENQLLKALPKMAKAATNPELRTGFTSHLAQTRRHVNRLARSLKIMGLPAKGKTCHAMLGLLEEGAEAISTKGPAAVRDAALIGAAQRVEHYEIAGYGTARAFAQTVGQDQVAELLRETLNEEDESNKELTHISVTVNADAFAASEEVSSRSSSRK